MKNILLKSVSPVLVAATILTSAATPVFAETTSDIDDYVYSMQYDKNNLLAQNGETLTSIPATSGSKKNGKFVVLKREKKNISNRNADISVTDFNGSNIYAGAILKADEGLVNNNPTVVSLPRGEISLSIDLPGMANGDSRTKVELPTKSSVRTAVNNLLSTWNNKQWSIVNHN